jgi:pimeloyl-ACP methyl ester carboxylesterase
LDPDFPLAISFIYGDDDWVKLIEGDTPHIICATNKFKNSKSHTLPTSDHNLHMDNPGALAQCIINDVFGTNEPLKENLLFK